VGWLLDSRPWNSQAVWRMQLAALAVRLVVWLVALAVRLVVPMAALVWQLVGWTSTRDAFHQERMEHCPGLQSVPQRAVQLSSTPLQADGEGLAGSQRVCQPKSALSLASADRG
jgi:hypothetical protein